MREPNVQRALEGKQIRKTIYVPDRIINFVAN
jgi:leucyl-tRNA synthetase